MSPVFGMLASAIATRLQVIRPCVVAGIWEPVQTEPPEILQAWPSILVRQDFQTQT